MCFCVTVVRCRYVYVAVRQRMTCVCVVLVQQRLMLQPETELSHLTDTTGELAVDMDSATFAWERPVSTQTKAEKGPYSAP